MWTPDAHGANHQIEEREGQAFWNINTTEYICKMTNYGKSMKEMGTLPSLKDQESLSIGDNIWTRIWRMSEGQLAKMRIRKGVLGSGNRRLLE